MKRPVEKIADEFDSVRIVALDLLCVHRLSPRPAKSGQFRSSPLTTDAACIRRIAAGFESIIVGE